MWEDYKSLYEGLTIQYNDQLLIITSAGCNVLNSLLKLPERIVAIDLNPYQNKLLEFKLQLYKYSDYETLSVLLGIKKTKSIDECLEQVKNLFSSEEYQAWVDFFKQHPEGLLCSGQLENYINNFYYQLDEQEQIHLHNMFKTEHLEEQKEIFQLLLSSTKFEIKFKEYFDDAHLSKGRDPKLFKYADENGGIAFYNRLVAHVNKSLLKDNFYIYFFFFGLKEIDEQLLPPCYRKENFHIIKNNTDIIEIHTGDVMEYIEKNKDFSINKASLSNIFEYTSTGVFEQSVASIKKNSKIKEFIFWNLLHEQGISKPSRFYVNQKVSHRISETESCFYFKNVRVLNVSL